MSMLPTPNAALECAPAGTCAAAPHRFTRCHNPGLDTPQYIYISAARYGVLFPGVPTSASNICVYYEQCCYCTHTYNSAIVCPSNVDESEVTLAAFENCTGCYSEDWDYEVAPYATPLVRRCPPLHRYYTVTISGLSGDLATYNGVHTFENCSGLGASFWSDTCANLISSTYPWTEMLGIADVVKSIVVAHADGVNVTMNRIAPNLWDDFDGTYTGGGGTAVVVGV